MFGAYKGTFRRLKKYFNVINLFFSYLESIVQLKRRKKVYRIQMTGRTEGISNPQMYMAVRLGERRFACDLNHVQEVQLYPHTGASSIDTNCMVLTLETSRGSIPVIDLLGRPVVPDSPGDRILVILSCTSSPIGIIADELLDNIEFDTSSVLPLPGGANGIENKYLKGIVELNEGTYYLINLEHVASSWLVRKDHARSGNSVSVGDEKK